jgi:hypothetical protein
MNIQSLSFNKYTLSATIPHNVIVYSDDNNTHTVTLNRFPLVADITKKEIIGATFKQPNKTIYYV